MSLLNPFTGDLQRTSVLGVGGAQPFDDDLTAISALIGTGIACRTAAGTWALRTLQPPAAGITIANPGGVLGDPTFALANDLAALEALVGTGIAVRSAADTWVQRSIAVTDTGSIDLTIANADGVAGNPTLSAAVVPGGITHSTLAGLTTGDAGHTQFWLLAGRPGGQVGIGGTGAGDDATLQSTSHATKGDLIFDDAQQWWPSIPDLSVAGATRVAQFAATLVMSPSSGESILSGYHFAPTIIATPSGVIVAATINALSMDVSGITPGSTGGLNGTVISTLDVSGTMVNTVANGLGNAILLRMRPTYESQTAGVAPFGFIQNVITARMRYNVASGTGTLTDSSCMTDIREFENVLAGGTFTISDVFTILSRPTFRETAGALNIGTRRGFWHDNATMFGTPAITLDVALDVEDTSVNTTTPLSLRSSGATVGMRHVGYIVNGANAGPTNTSVGIEIQSTTKAFLPSRMTTTQRDALTAVNGMILYNTTTNTLQGRIAGVWANL